MTSRAAYPSIKISCPICSKTMLLKNWKNHCQTKHRMHLSEEKLKKEYEKLKQTAGSSTCLSASENVDSTINTLFSTKNFSLTRTASAINTTDDQNINDCISDDNFTNISTSQDLPMATTNDPKEKESLSNNHQLVLSTAIYENMNIEIEVVINEAENQHTVSLSSAEPTDIDTHLQESSAQTKTREQQDNDMYSDTSSDSDSESQNSNYCRPTTANVIQKQTIDIDNPDRPITTSFLSGVIFINIHEMHFIDEQRAKHPHIPWYPRNFKQHKKQKINYKPSSNWFTKERQWLRAVCSNGNYGLLCTYCSEFASDKLKIERSDGAFVVRPFWKLKHKGIEGIREHESSDLHRSSKERRIISKSIEANGDIIGQLRCTNMHQQTEKYLSVLVQVFWCIIHEELPLRKFKTLIQLLDKVQCPGVTEWMKLSNNKQKYWGKEAISEWLLSIHSYIYQQQISSIKKTDFINIIVDETQDISIRKMVSICLRYVEKDTGTIQEQLFKVEPTLDTTGEGYFFLIEKFIGQLEKDANKRFIITAQTYDGVSSMRYQTSGHVRARLSAWGFYIYCRSHLLNLAVKDAGEDYFHDSFDTIKSTLVYIRDSPQRLEILFNCQKLNGTRHTVPKASRIRWSYNYEILRFTVKHYLPIVQTRRTISQLKGDGFSDAKRYACFLLKYETVFEICILKNIFIICMKFLRQIESRGACLDSFSLHVEVAATSISKVVEDFDFQSFQSLMNDLYQYTPTITSTANSTRSRRNEMLSISVSEDFDEDKLRNNGEEMITSVLTSLSGKFDSEAKDLVKNLTMLSTPSNFAPDELLQNSLILTYANEISYEHTSVDKRTFKRTDSPLLIFNRLKEDVHSFLVLAKGLNTIQSILQQLAKHGEEQAFEWYKLYQILCTFAIGSNEAERSFSTLRRIKPWQRN
ncbi:unnamed protein product [Rotaria sp. Silwood2]|nr:unnamed protein product [Rotaria sp. Silwood2]